MKKRAIMARRVPLEQTSCETGLPFLIESAYNAILIQVAVKGGVVTAITGVLATVLTFALIFGCVIAVKTYKLVRSWPKKRDEISLMIAVTATKARDYGQDFHANRSLSEAVYLLLSGFPMTDAERFDSEARFGQVLCALDALSLVQMKGKILAISRELEAAGALGLVDAEIKWALAMLACSAAILKLEAVDNEMKMQANALLAKSLMILFDVVGIFRT